MDVSVRLRTTNANSKLSGKVEAITSKLSFYCIGSVLKNVRCLQFGATGWRQFGTWKTVGALCANAFLSPPECSLLGKQHSLEEADRVLFFLGVTLQPAFYRIRHKIRYQCDYEEMAGQDLAQGQGTLSANSSLIRLYYESPLETQASLIKVIGDAVKSWEIEFSKMKDLVQLGCNHRRDDQQDKVVCYLKATYAEKEAGSGKKRRGFFESIRSLFRG